MKKNQAGTTVEQKKFSPARTWQELHEKLQALLRAAIAARRKARKAGAAS